MGDAFVHRGPDGGGTHANAGVALGMRRLAIVDIASGEQPMANDDGTLVLVFNGEIYNAPALRSALQAQGVSFRTRSDTEVILRLYEQAPDDVERHLAGMWAFAILDRRRRQLVLSRDRFGIKPLFVAHGSGPTPAFAFASELQSFRALADLRAFAGILAPDPAAAHAMLSWSYVPGHRTIYRGVTRAPPATRLTVDLLTGSRHATTFYALRPNEDAAKVTSLAEAQALTRLVLVRSVREHLESDVPVATFLSGGIDSGLVTALAAEASPRPLEVFSLGFADRAFDESAAARHVAARLGLRHHVEILDPRSLPSLLLPALRAYDEPFGDSSGLATFALSRFVARTHKVALGGDGGDEAFAGYRKHRLVTAREAIPGAATRHALGAALSFLPRGGRGSRVTNLARMLRRLGRGLRGSDAQGYTALTQVASLAATSALVPATVRGAEAFEAAYEALFTSTEGSLLQRTLASDLGNLLPNDMLTKVDRASMAASLEARVPFLDHRVVEVGLGLPQPYTLGRSGKVVLRGLAATVLGEDHARLPKRGFEVPVERWLGTELASACDRLFAAHRLERYGLLEPRALDNGGWRSLLHTMPQVLWHAFALAVWCEDNLGGQQDFVEETLADPGTRQRPSAHRRPSRMSPPENPPSAEVLR